MSRLGKKELAGVRVVHDLDDFQEETEVILTLKDSYLLESQDVNRGGDVLENVEMASHFKSQAIQQSRVKKDDYLEGKYGGAEKKILPQYDEIQTEKEGIVLDSTGEFNLEKQKKLEAIKNKLASKKGGEISLETNKNIASEYFTSEEMKGFKKPMKKVVNVKKNREDILKMLEESLGDEDDHHGSRDVKKARERDALDDITTKKVKAENYEIALQKAREQTYSSMIDEEYEGMQKAIENQRRAQRTKVTKVEDVVRDLIENNKSVNQPADNKDLVIINNNTVKKPAGSEFVELSTINTATDFLNTVATKDVIVEQKKMITEPLSFSMKDMKKGTASVVNVSLPSEKLLAWKKAQNGLESAKPVKKETTTENGEKIAEENNETITAEEIDKMNEEVSFIQEEDLGKGGMMAALRAAREKGYLFENEIEVSGRSKDKTYREELAKFGEEKKDGKTDYDINLEYRDRQGRLMKPKEAFRYQCRIFHGISQSKNKQEKERKKFEAGRKLLQTAPNESASMKALNKLQQQNAQPYVILNTKNQPNK